MELPTPPASLPPAQQKEYIILKQKIAQHERNLHERKKKKLSTNTSRSSSPLSLSRTQTASLPPFVKPGHSGSKPSSSPVVSNSAEVNVNSGCSVVEATEKQKATVAELEDCTRKMRHYKSLEEQEQRTLTELTNQLAESVSEIEEHECNMDAIQKQLLSLQKQLEVRRILFLWFYL